MATSNIYAWRWQRPPVTSRMEVASRCQKNLDEPVMANGLDVHVYIESGSLVLVKD